jgi:hypothetical protein
MEQLCRRDLEHGLMTSLESFAVRASIGYGYYPTRAILEILGLTVLGWIICRRSHLAGTMAPSDKKAYKEFKDPRGGGVPGHYPRFSPLIRFLW